MRPNAKSSAGIGLTANVDPRIASFSRETGYFSATDENPTDRYDRLRRATTRSKATSNRPKNLFESFSPRLRLSSQKVIDHCSRFSSGRRGPDSAQHTVDPDPLTGYVISRGDEDRILLFIRRAHRSRLRSPIPPLSARSNALLSFSCHRLIRHLRNALDAGRRHSASQ